MCTINVNCRCAVHEDISSGSGVFASHNMLRIDFLLPFKFPEPGNNPFF